MPLKINLYHEVIRAKHEEQYDPLRLSMLGLIVVMVGLAGYYAFALAGKSSVQSALSSKQQEFDQLTPLVKAAKEQEDVLSKKLALAENITKRIEDRFYWGPLFEQIVTAVPRNVQITRCSGDIARDAQRRGQLMIEGISAGSEPRQVAEELRVLLTEKLSGMYKNVNATFRNLDEGTEKVMLDGARLSTANFTISISFATKVPDPIPEPRRTPRRLAQQNP